MESGASKMEEMVGKKRLQDFYKGKRVFLTGHTGFKGSWLAVLLSELGADIKGYSLPPTEESLYLRLDKVKNLSSNYGDIGNLERLKDEISKFQPELIFHLAAQPLVIDSYKDPIGTYQTNVIGTANLLESVRAVSAKAAVVVITTDKVYKNNEWEFPYREVDQLGGYDPYSSSKACTELLTSSYRNSFFNLNDIAHHGKSVATARAGNVIGGGDMAAYRIIPDIIKAIMNEENLKLRNPQAVRPWQHVIEPIVAYLILAKKLYQEPHNCDSSYNFGPTSDDTRTVKELATIAHKILKPRQAKIEFENNEGLHEANLLRLDISKSINSLGWKPIYNSMTAIEKTIFWYKKVLFNKEDALEAIKQDVEAYFKLL